MQGAHFQPSSTPEKRSITHMQHIWKVLLTSLLIFALAATACLAEDSEAQYQAYSYTTFSLRRTPSESDRGITVRKKTKILILE